MTTGEFTVQGIPISQIAAEFGTPLYVYDGDVLEHTYRELRDALHPAVDVLLSLKANPNVSVCGLLARLGAGAEVSSLVELRTAQRAGVAGSDTIFLGPGKTIEELAACADAGLHAVVVENLDELKALDRLAAARGGDPLPVILRVNPDFASKGSGLSMGGKPRQFGMDADVLRTHAESLRKLDHLRICGFHAYMGTRFLAHADIVHNTREILATAEALADELEIPLETVDFGGGFGVAYFDNEDDLDVAATVAGINTEVDRFTGRHPECRLILELGRYLTAAAGTYVVRTLYTKESMGRAFVVVDGGTNHHMAAVGIGSFVKRDFPIRTLGPAGEPTQVYTVAGPLCTPNDVIGKKVRLPPVEPGDLLGVERSGAYGPSASPGLFLSHGFPAEVLVHQGTPHLVRERDGVEDLLAKQRLIAF
ncbi:alanine racemase [Actinoallomurus acanthiterrae]